MKTTFSQTHLNREIHQNKTLSNSKHQHYKMIYLKHGRNNLPLRMNCEQVALKDPKSWRILISQSVQMRSKSQRKWRC